MKRTILLLAAVASVASTMPLAAPAFARDGDQGRRAERHDNRGGAQRGGPERRGEDRRGQGQDRGGQDRGGPPDRGGPDRGGQDRGGQRWQAQDRRRDDEGDRRRYEERPRYEERRRYDDSPPRPNYMSPAPGVASRRGYAPESYRGGVVDDYRRYRLRPPPQGYDWVRMGNGFGLVERGSGRIYDRVN
jgi:Ni/Co efflux regulator RcnB